MAQHYKLKPKPKIEFSKKLLIALLVISFLFTATSYVLAFLDKQTVENLSIELLRIIWGVDGLGILAYTMQNGVRAWSLNKYGASENKIDEYKDKSNETEIIEEEVNDE